MPSTYQLISSNVLSSSAASVTFSAIPSTYTDLVLRASIRSTTAGTYSVVGFTVNGSATGYSYTRLNGNGATASSDSASSTTDWNATISPANGSTANTFGSFEFYLPNYAGSAYKVASFAGFDEENAATAYMRNVAALWQNSSAISSMTFTSASGDNIAAGSSFYLYGIKNS